MIFNIYAAPLLVSGVLTLILGGFVLSTNHRLVVNRVFALMCLSIFIWLASYSVFFCLRDEDEALTWIRVAYLGVIFIPVTVHHLAISFVNKMDCWDRILVGMSYPLGLCLLALTFTGHFFGRPYTYFWGFYPKAGPLYNFFMVFFIFYYGRGLTELYFAAIGRRKEQISAVHREAQVKYLCLALAIALVASIDFLPKYGIVIYPFGYIFMLGFVSIIAYAIVAHQLLDIEVVIRRTAVFAGLFAFVYGVFTVVTVIGKSFFETAFGWNQWISMVPTVIVITLTLRPLENFLTDATERFLFQKDYDYRDLLKTFTNEVLTVLDLQKLTEQTVLGLNKIIKLESASILLSDKETKSFKLVAGIGVKDKAQVFAENDAIASYLKQTHQPILRTKSVDQMTGHSNLRDDFKKLNARLCLPVAHHDELIGILSLGMKKSGEEFSQEDIDILSTLARTLGIAIANAQLFDELSKTQAEAAQREKMAVIGTLAAGINHEICNPLGIVRGQCEMYLLNLRDGLYNNKTREDMNQIASEIMNKVIKETDRATAITKKLSGFAKPAKKVDSEEVFVEKEADEVLGLIGHDLRLNNIEFKKDFSPNFPPILADRRQIQEVLFNIIRNAAQAMEKDKKDGSIDLSGSIHNGSAVIKIADNGSGIPQDKINQIFNPFFTTKEPGKGTGLGLFIVKQVIERNHGTIQVDSQEGVGTTFTLTFPVAAAAQAKVLAA